MKANPGGQIDPKDAFGRDELIEQIWTILDAQSIYMNAERRIGKSTILTKLDANPQKGWRTVKRDLEGIHTAEEFAGRIYKDVEQYLEGKKIAVRKVGNILQRIGGMEIGGVLKFPDGKPAPWKTIIDESIQDLNEACKETNEKVVFLWDEVPFMLENIRTSQGEATAMQILDVLRSLRQTFANVRMVLTGSIGLHHVVSTLKQDGYANAPINDMAAVGVGAITAVDGMRLALALLKGERIEAEDHGLVAQAISERSGQIPYYIHHLVRQLKFVGGNATVAKVDAILLEQLKNVNDPWELRQYRERIDTYYSSNVELVLAILDSVAIANEAIGFDQLFNEAKASVALHNKERFRNMLTLLQRDHYIERDQAGAFSFISTIVRDWWRINRYLQA